MRTLAHIVNPVIVPPSSDLYIAQPITFESMKIAKKNASDIINVTLFSAQYEEDVNLVPPFFTKTPNLNKSILDIKSFKKRRKLPFIKDILDRLYQNSQAEYLVYSNVDIAVQPNFYLELNRLIEKGYDAFVINRRTISSEYQLPEELPLMYKDHGKKHPGYDCFIFKRELYPNFKLGQVVIGTNRIGISITTNLISYAKKMGIFKNRHLTFHIGEERSWRNPDYDDYILFNYKEYLAISKTIRSDIGGLKKYYRHLRILGISRFIQMLKHI